MKLPPEIIEPQFIIRYIIDDLTSKEKESLDNWLEESDANKEEFGSLVLLWDRMGHVPLPKTPNTNDQWNAISNKISDIESLKADHSISNSMEESPVLLKSHFNDHKKYYKENKWQWVYRAAAIIIISLGFLIIYNNYKQTESIDSPNKIVINNPTINDYQLVTHKGERITFPLSDGSIVYLNSDSKLTYPNIFSDNERVVRLSGEAYFSVKHDKNKPFRVLCENTITTVTGTEFNIRNRNDKIIVVVAKGSVVTSDLKSEQAVNLIKGEMASFNARGICTKSKNIKLGNYLAWRTNKLFFSKTPLVDAMHDIERYYNVNVIFQTDSVKQKSISGIFETESLDNVLSIISLTLDVNIVHTGNKVIVK